jgi:hypothetical protein
MMSPQEKRHGVTARIRTSDLTIKRPIFYHLSYPVTLELAAKFKEEEEEKFCTSILPLCVGLFVPVERL